MESIDQAAIEKGYAKLAEGLTQYLNREDAIGVQARLWPLQAVASKLLSHEYELNTDVKEIIEGLAATCVSVCQQLTINLDTESRSVAEIMLLKFIAYHMGTPDRAKLYHEGTYVPVVDAGQA